MALKLLTLEDLLDAAKKKENQNKTTKTTQKTTTKKNTANNLTKEQKQAVETTVKNIKNEGSIKGSLSTIRETAQNKSEANLKSKYSDVYKQMGSEGFSDTEITQSLKKREAQEKATKQMEQNISIPSGMVDRTDKQKDAYRQLIKEGYSESEAKQAMNNYRKKIDSSMTSGEKRKTRLKALSQGVSDVGQRQVGHVIDWAAGNVAQKLEGTAIAEGIRNTATKIFGEDEVKAFQEANKDAKIGDMTKGNILTDQEENSGIGQRWRKGGQYGALAAESMAAGGIASGGAKAIGTAAGSKLVGGLAGTVIGAGEGAIGADAFTRGLEDRAATKKERTTGAVLGGAFGGISGYRQTAKALAQNKELEKLVQDTSNRGVKRAIKEGRVTTKNGLLKTETVQELSQKEKDALNIIRKEGLGNSKNPGKLVTNINKSISKTAEEMSDDMKNIKVTNRGKQELKQNLKAAIENANTPGQKTKIKTVLKQLNDVTDADKLWKLRKTYDDLFSEAVKSYNPNGPTPMQEIWLEGRQILNDGINAAAENAGTSAVKEGMKRLSTMITAENTITNNLAKQVGKDQLTRLGRLLLGAKNTTRKALGTAAVGGGGAALGIKIVGNNSSNE